MGEASNNESDFVRVMTSLFKDDIESAVRTVFKNRIRPAFNKTMSDSLKDIVDIMFGNTPSTSNIPAGAVQVNTNKVNYSGISTAKVANTSLPASSNTSASVSKTNYNGLPKYVIVGSFDDAQNIVNYMNDVILKEGEVSVNEFFDCAGRSNDIAGNSVAAKYGWNNIDGHTITQMADGQWMLSMPPYEFLK